MLTYQCRNYNLQPPQYYIEHATFLAGLLKPFRTMMYIDNIRLSVRSSVNILLEFLVQTNSKQ